MENDFGLARWRSARALAKLYFDRSNHSEIADQIERYWKSGKSDRNVSEVLSKDKGWGRIDQLIELEPSFNLSIKQAAVYWFRFGFQMQSRGIALSARFLKRYAQWRHELASESGGTTVVCVTDKRSPNNRKESSYLLDYFLHAPNLDFDVAIYRTLTVSLVNDIKEEPNATPARETADHVGRHAYLKIGDIVKAATRGRSINGLTPSKEERGRYICQLTRDELVTKMQVKFPELRTIATSTIVRCIGDFVACSRC